MRTICIFTGTRAEYGLLRPLIGALGEAKDVSPKLLVSGSHFANSLGATWKEIASDGLIIDEQIEVVLDSDSEISICTAMGLGMMRYGEALQRMKVDCLVLLGDRYEAFAAAAAATVCRIPIAHLYGGELTFGAIDDAFRHAITKMSHLHFTSTEPYRQRVIQLGENPDHVFNVGALGVENARGLALLNRDEVERRLNLQPGQKYFLVTLHPATLDKLPPEAQISGLLDALMCFPDHVSVITGANADVGGGSLNRLLAERATQQPGKFRFFMSLGTNLYLSAVRSAEAVVGNSSSAIIEVPSFRIPSVDIGSRQAGRVRASSVLHCESNVEDIKVAIRKALSAEFRALAATSKNPYEKENTVSAIVEVLTSHNFAQLLQKKFYDLKFGRTQAS